MKMAFKRYFRPEDLLRGVTPRRLAAARKALKSERDRRPLFADLVASTQPTPEERVQKADQGCIESTRDSRKIRADHWREARKQLRALSVEDRQGILDYWNRKVYPLTPEYLFGLIRSWTVDGWRPAFYGEDDLKKWAEGRVRLAKLFEQWRKEGKYKV